MRGRVKNGHSRFHLPALTHRTTQRLSDWRCEGTRMWRLRFALVVLCCAGSVAPPMVRGGAMPPLAIQDRKTSEPYTGDLSIFDSPGREQRLQINRVMDILGIQSGKAVADIGAGSGWFTMHAAKRIGADGVVYAADINPEAVRYIKERAEKEKLGN